MRPYVLAAVLIIGYTIASLILTSVLLEIMQPIAVYLGWPEVLGDLVACAVNFAVLYMTLDWSVKALLNLGLD